MMHGLHWIFQKSELLETIEIIQALFRVEIRVMYFDFIWKILEGLVFNVQWKLILAGMPAMKDCKLSTLKSKGAINMKRESIVNIWGLKMFSLLPVSVRNFMHNVLEIFKNPKDNYMQNTLDQPGCTRYISLWAVASALPMRRPTL